MNISEKDLKKLWGLAAGMCAFPGCQQDCLVFVDLKDPTVLGEMAHVIAQSPKGPRGKATGGEDTYENLILLCPTHHRLVDKAPSGYYKESDLLSWKAQHEARVRERLSAPIYETRTAVAQAVLALLQENHAVWRNYGPESEVAKVNPVSNMATLWTLRKLSVIVPNNRQIASALTTHRSLFSPAQYATVAEFLEHAAGFEASAYDRRDAVPRFPKAFEEMIRDAADE